MCSRLCEKWVWNTIRHKAIENCREKGEYIKGTRTDKGIGSGKRRIPGDQEEIEGKMHIEGYWMVEKGTFDPHTTLNFI